MADIKVSALPLSNSAYDGTEYVLGIQTDASVKIPATDFVNTIASGTGAVSRTVKSKLNDVISVKDYGAVGDGVTDDTAAIQAGINYCANNSQSLNIPAGNYLVDKLSIPHLAYFELTGSGIGSTKLIKKTSDGNNLIEINKSGAGYMVLDISEISLVGISGNTPSVLYLESIVRSTIKRLNISNGIIGLRLAGGISNLISNCIIQSNQYGIDVKRLSIAYLGGWPNNNTIADRTVISGNTLAGVNFDDGRVLVIDGCDIENNGTSGNSATGGLISGSNIGQENGGATVSIGMVVSGGCWLEANAGQAAIMAASGKLIVENNNFVANANATNDIYISGGKYMLFENDHDTAKAVVINEGAGVANDNYIIHCDFSSTNCDYTKTQRITSKAFIGDTYLGDFAGNESIRVVKIANAVNRWNIYGNTTANAPVIQAEGSDANIHALISAKGTTGQVHIYTNSVGTKACTFSHTASAVNFYNITGGVTGNNPEISAQGSDADVSVKLTPKGVGSIFLNGPISTLKTVTAGGTTGAQTINKAAGTVNFAAVATSLVVTNSLVTTSSIIICTVGTNDTTMKSALAVAASGSFTINANAAATAETRVNFLVIN